MQLLQRSMGHHRQRRGQRFKHFCRQFRSTDHHLHGTGWTGFQVLISLLQWLGWSIPGARPQWCHLAPYAQFTLLIVRSTGSFCCPCWYRKWRCSSWSSFSRCCWPGRVIGPKPVSSPSSAHRATISPWAIPSVPESILLLLLFVSVRARHPETKDKITSMEIQIRRSVANCQKPDEQNKRFFIAEKGGFCQKKSPIHLAIKKSYANIK